MGHEDVETGGALLAGWREARRRLGSPRAGVVELIEAAVAVTWSERPLSACHEILTEELDLSWRVPDVQVGDLVVTVVRTEPPLVAAVDRVVAIEPEHLVLDAAARPDGPLVWDELARAADLLGACEDTLLSPEAAQRLLAALSTALHDPDAVLVPALPCRPGAPSAQDLAVAVTAVLMGRASGAGRCDACDRVLNPATIEVHHFDPPGEPTGSEVPLVERASRVGLLCQDCHRMCHEPSLEQMRRWMEPPCPCCGSRLTVALRVDEVPPVAASGPRDGRFCPDCGTLYGTVVRFPGDDVED